MLKDFGNCLCIDDRLKMFKKKLQVAAWIISLWKLKDWQIQRWIWKLRSLTLMDSRSLFFCISCFSSSTILDMASFSMSCSFSVICKDNRQEETGSRADVNSLWQHRSQLVDKNGTTETRIVKDHLNPDSSALKLQQDGGDACTSGRPEQACPPSTVWSAGH